MNYNKFTFFSPPRPENKVSPSFLLNSRFQEGWVGQAKMNGTYNFIGVAPDKSLHCLKRDGTEHRNWRPGPANAAAFANLPGDGWYVFMAELMNDKVGRPDLKNINYIHDIIVDSGEMLVGSTYLERYCRLRSLFDVRSAIARDADHYYVIDEHTWLASIYEEPKEFASIYSRLIQEQEIEGLVLKNVHTRLSVVDMCRGMVKVRRPTKNYGF
jgi:hypothetical protein